MVYEHKNHKNIKVSLHDRRYLYRIYRLVGPLAQLVEQLTLNQRVKGSNPLGITSIIITLVYAGVLFL